MAPHDRAGPPGAIYSSSRGLLEQTATFIIDTLDYIQSNEVRCEANTDFVATAEKSVLARYWTEYSRVYQ